MANKKIMRGMLAAALVFGLIVAACDNGTTDNTNTEKDSPQTVRYTSGDYELTITENTSMTVSRAVYSPCQAIPIL